MESVRSAVFLEDYCIPHAFHRCGVDSVKKRAECSNPLDSPRFIMDSGGIPHTKGVPLSLFGSDSIIFMILAEFSGNRGAFRAV